MSLYPHQNKALTDLRNAYRTHSAPVLVAGCGYGKSCVAAEISRLITARGRRVLVLAHRIELIEQLTDTFQWWGVDMSLCDIKMVQSATRKVEQLPHYDFIIVDEAHHSTCNTYTNILNHYPNTPRLFMTATPQRTSGQGLGDVADVIVNTVSVKWLIANNYLAPFEYYAPKILVDVEKLKIKRGDYEQAGIIQQLNKPKIYGDVIEKYKQFADGKKSIVFASSIEHSKLVCEAFNAVGINAEHIDGKTKKTERHDIMQRFRTGATQILCNYEIISEGISVDDCECCILLRPTQSLILYIQSSMRCMRYQPNKTAIILDMVGNFERFGLPDTEHEWSLKSKVSNRKTSNNEVKNRTCGRCFRTYAGISATCPYCGYDNGRTKAQIKADEKAELERIEEVKINERKKEERQAVTLQELIELGERRGYKNPAWWARNKYKNSWRNR